MMEIWFSCRPSVAAMRAMTAALAFPRSGADETCSFTASPSRPTMRSRDAPGTTFTFSVAIAIRELLGAAEQSVQVEVRIDAVVAERHAVARRRRRQRRFDGCRD